MCGINGLVSFEPGAFHATALSPGLEALRHRGPDDWGVWADDHCVLGQRRLAIIDLSSAGRAPLSNEAGTIWLTYNGEVYNFQALRQELVDLGHRFVTRTDTEVVVHAYEEWGPDCVKRLRGMFALAIWDQPRRRLFLARDRVGKKPLFYTQTGQGFFFASELQSLLAAPGVSREIDLAAIDDYLSWGYVPAPRTAFRHIFKLPPAHWLVLDLAKPGTPQIERYWSLDYGPKHRLTEEEASATLREKLTEAVRLRLISDVPLGAFLSGGIDSSIVVGLMAELSDRPVNTFSIGFKEAAFNELTEARRVAERWGTKHHEFVVEPDALAILPQLVRHYGEPYADSSAIPTFYVSQLTRRSVTVALNGDGGDESFAGYDRYWGNRVAEGFQSVPGLAGPTRLMSRLLPGSVGPKSRLRQAKRFLAALADPMAQRYGRWIGYFSAEAKEQLYRRELQDCLAPERGQDWFEAIFAKAQGLDPVDAAMAVDINSYLPFDLLVKVDITSMANSLEARSPFLDHEVMEFAARLPVNLKLRGREAKYLLKRTFADLLPKENLNRRKMGFGVPVGQWFRGPLRELLGDTLLSAGSQVWQYLQPGEVRRLVTTHLSGREDYSGLLWNLLMLELWHREMVVPAPKDQILCA